MGMYSIKHFFSQPFRPFFWGAGLYAIFSILVWIYVYALEGEFQFGQVSPMIWHAHEMVFGYSSAVIAGFLLTAVQNWTGKTSCTPISLFTLVALWLAGRVAPFVSTGLFDFATGFFNISFLALLFLMVLRPILVAKSWRQLGILSKLAFLIFFEVLFFSFQESIEFQRIGLYGALFLIIALILVISRRVYCFFHQKTFPSDAVKNLPLLDKIMLPTYLSFWYFYLIGELKGLSIVSLILCLTLTARLYFWYTNSIWKASLLWSFFISIVWICVGFLLMVLQSIISISPFLSIHAFTFGGIGGITLSMMSRVILGHTGRNVRESNMHLNVMFVVFNLGAIARVLMPILDAPNHMPWIKVSFSLWVLAFLLFVFRMTPILWSERLKNIADN